MNNRYNESYDEIDLMEVFFALVKRIPIIILSTIIGAGIAFGYTHYFMTPTYVSTTRVYVVNNESESTQITLGEFQSASQLTNDYIDFTTSRLVLEGVIEKQHLDMGYGTLKANVKVSSTANGRNITISVTNTNPKKAMEIANAIREETSATLGQVVEFSEIVEKANLPSSPSGPSLKKNVMMGAMVGFIIPCGIITLFTVLDDRIKTEEDINKYIGLKTLGQIPDETKVRRSRKSKAKGKK